VAGKPGKSAIIGEIALCFWTMHAVALTSVGALRERATDNDSAVATTVLRAVADALSIATEQLEALAAERSAK
jgi:hypothetical protein